ncbi:MAG: hypothetical protein A2X45_19675 [Lentisphaerae bacterium GWF2_50_93]|nr:MAG: hypothetical protein A2X45_19675 [Lentisphaerae bacterium GWF2_50_93]
MKNKYILMLLLSLILTGCKSNEIGEATWEYDGSFHRTIVEAETEFEKKIKEPENSLDSMDSKEKLKDKYIRQTFLNKEAALYSSLFQLMGCLTMQWDARYIPWQVEAYSDPFSAWMEQGDTEVSSVPAKTKAA